MTSEWMPIETAPKCDHPATKDEYYAEEKRGPKVLLLIPNKDGYGGDFIVSAWWAYPSGYGPVPYEGRWVSYYTEASSETAVRGDPTYWMPIPSPPQGT